MIHEAEGPEIDTECRKIGYSLRGEAKITNGYNLRVIRNELIYIIESITQSDRQTFMRFNASNFDVIDERVPVHWRTSAIDLHEEVLKVKLLFQEVGSSGNEFTEPLKALEAFKAKVVVSGADKLHDFEYLHELCDDSLGE